MKRQSPLIVLMLFLRDRAGAFLLCAFTAGLFLLVGSLSHLDMTPLMYALELTGLMILIVGIISFSRYYHRHVLLLGCQNALEDLQKALPPARGLMEEDFRALLLAITQERLQEKTAQARLKKEQEDYYTLWVHQIKTPISALRLLVQEGGDLDTRQMEAELFKIGQYADMALQYLRLDSLSADLELRPYDLYELTKKAVKKYSLLFINKKIALEMEPFSAQVLTDEKWFSLILEQVISNAVKYTVQGTVSIFLHDDKTLAIRDTGIGIRREDLPRVFERGFTGFNGRLDQRATGIGLYLCHEASTKLGHSLSIESELGRGTTVFIDIAKNDLKIF